MSVAKNFLIGIFVLIAFAIIIFILLFLHPSIGDEGHTLHVRFTDVDKINIGTRVTYAGLPVGEVVAIYEIPEARTKRISHNGKVYVYELVLKVDSSVNVYNTDRIVIQTSGLLGERNVEIDPQPQKPGEKLYLLNNEVIYAVPSGSIEDTLKDFGSLSAKLQQTLDAVSEILDEFKNEKVVHHVGEITRNLEDITGSLNRPKDWGHLVDNLLTLSERAKHSWNTVDNTLQNFYDVSERSVHTWNKVDDAALTLNSTLDNFYSLSKNVNSTWSTLDTSLKTSAGNFNEISSDLRIMIRNTTLGQGSVGRLFVNDDLYLRLKSILNKGETIAGDINRYGLLFHSNKNWQRANAWRNNILRRLSTPEKFTAHFRNEFDKISTSLSNVSLVLDESAAYPNQLLCDPNFAFEFAELLRKVEMVDESLKMYNEQIISLDECQ